MFEEVLPGDVVLVLWTDIGEATEQFQRVVHQLQAGVGPGGKVCVENTERLSMSGYSPSTFSRVYSGCVGLASAQHTVDTLASLTSLLRPGGQLTFLQMLGSDQDPAQLSSSLVLAGLVARGSPTLLDTHPQYDATVTKLDLAGGGGRLYRVTATKPNHEVGASRLLSFAKLAPAAAPAAPAANVWVLEDMEDDTVELVDDSELLGEEDLVKPDPASLRVCGTTGKRKACKDCSCGLKEELDSGKEPTKKDFTSSCGSCYLGDAFRCGSCPYLGMPAFNPGDKVSLSQRQLNPDLREAA